MVGRLAVATSACLPACLTSTNWGIWAGRRPRGGLLDGHWQVGATQMAGSHW